MSDEVLLARAFLSRVGEPAALQIWEMVREHGPVAAAAQLRTGSVNGRSYEAVRVRATRADPHGDLEVAERHGIRLVVPESDEWPHFAFSALEAAGLRRLSAVRAGSGRDGSRRPPHGGEPVPPLALWVRGNGFELPLAGMRSVAIVGSRSATSYGLWVAGDFAARLAQREFVVVSGGAYGVDAAAHRGALSVAGQTMLVSAGGLDRPYPAANDRLYDQVAESGLLVCESPPGSAPQRRRFLTRNRLIAALSTGTIVVEAARRSGATNTAAHCSRLGRVLMAVPGPITSAMSVGCHALLAADQDRALLVSRVEDVLEYVGCASDLPAAPASGGSTDRLDELEPTERQVFDGFPARGDIDPEGLAVTTGLDPLTVLQALPGLELAGFVEAGPAGYRLVGTARRARG